MGDGEVNIAVADAGPLIHLAEIQCLPFLRVFDVLHIPDAVWLETIGHGRLLQEDILGLGIFQRHTIPQSEVMRFAQEQGCGDLQSGERECIYLCRLKGLSVLLTDDLAVREKCKRLNLVPVGSLGIVVKAYRLGHISLANAEKHISDLYDVSSLFVARAIVELAIEQLHKLSNKE